MNIRSLYILLVFIIPFHINGQKVGLVLSGGGSRGLAHIGVIKALEDNNIPIDYITGTSIGAIIGSLYAGGYSPEEMIEILSSERIKHWIDDDIEIKYSYYLKQDQNDASWFQINLDPKSQYIIELPSSILSPALMDFIFMEWLSGPSAAANYDFDSLFIPFRCVAADITNNQAYIFSKGNLSTAVRASMTFPFYFKPIKHQGRVMFDGGMYNNFPADIMQTTFWPDVIIGSKVSTNYPPPSEDNLLSQVQNMLMVDADYSMEDYNGVLIEPHVPIIPLVDFSQTAALIDSGYLATLEELDTIKSIVHKRCSSKKLKAKREYFRSKIPEIIIDTVYTQGVKPNQIEYLNKSILHESSISEIETIKMEYLKLYSDNLIDNIYPTANYNDSSGLYDLSLNIKLKKNFISYFGGHISSSPFNQAFLRLDYNKISIQAFQFSFSTHIGRFYNAAKLRARITHATKIPFYFETSFTLNGYDYFGPNRYFYQEQEPSYLVHKDNFWSIDFGFPASRKGKIVLSFNTGRITNSYYQIEQFQRSDTADVSYLDFISPKFTFEINSLNKKQYATEGHKFRTRVWYLSSLEETIPGNTIPFSKQTSRRIEVWKLQLNLESYYKVSRILTIGLSGECVLSTQNASANYTSTLLLTNQFMPTTTSKILYLPKYRAFNYAALGIQTVIRIAKHADIRLEAYAFQPYHELYQKDDYNVGLNKAFKDHNYILNSSLIYHTQFGPLSLSFDYFSKNEDKTAFMLNFGYIIFNERSLF